MRRREVEGDASPDAVRVRAAAARPQRLARPLVLAVACAVLTATGATVPVALVASVSASALEVEGATAPAVDHAGVGGAVAVPLQAGEGLDPGAAAEDGDAGEGGGRTGPEPTGQPLPDRSQRIVDSAIWLGLLAVLAVAFVAVARLWWTSPSVRPVLGVVEDDAGDDRREGRRDDPDDGPDGSVDRPAEGVEGQG